LTRRLEIAVERWPIAGRFTIARGAKTEAVVVVATLRDGAFAGRGEAVPYLRYGETVEGVAAAIGAMGGALAEGMDRAALLESMPAGAARNALDCALWDIEAKTIGRRAAAIAGLQPLRPLDTAYTLSLGTPEEMAAAAAAASDRPLLKLKLGGAGDAARLKAVRGAAPKSRLIVDANESWSAETFAENLAAATAAQVELIEQPLPAANDAFLATVPHPVPICADESLHVADDIPALVGRYDAVNVKLDKAGGLTGALALGDTAKAAGLIVMVGCMVATSLAMAPAMLVAQQADFVDLDGPLLLAGDRAPALRYDGSRVYPPEPELWG
jgi:L-alanine-DL-glutamate epimerase-like enolase superfamily enzyme